MADAPNYRTFEEWDRSFERLMLVPERPNGSLNAAIRTAFEAGRRGGQEGAPRLVIESDV